MTSITYAAVNIQASAHSAPSPPGWFGEATLLAHHLQRHGVLAAIADQVRFARRRFGHYDVIDFVVVLVGYAAIAERTLEAVYARLQPWAGALHGDLRARPPAHGAALFGAARLDNVRCFSKRHLPRYTPQYTRIRFTAVTHPFMVSVYGPHR